MAITREKFQAKHSMSCDLANLIYAIRCNGCAGKTILETGDVLRNRVTVHRQQIRDLQTKVRGFMRCRIRATAHGFSFYKILDGSYEITRKESKLFNLKYKTILNNSKLYLLLAHNL